MRTIDLRSDTVTRPSPEMRRVMADAEVGDDVFGEDRTVRRLEEHVAELLGKEAALYVPSGTMANQIALAVLTSRGDEVYCDVGCHLFNFEGGAPALLSGVQLHPIPGERGVFTRAQVEERLRPDDHHFPPSAVVAVENTHNRGGGTVWPRAGIEALRALCQAHGMRTHMDGARLWNAAASSGVSEREWADYADTVSVCFSKGLGAPVGSAIAGTRALIDQAHRMRKRLGGGMRQAGIVAAGALYALEHNRARLGDDHRRARALAEGIASLPGLHIDPALVDSNICIVEVEAGRHDAARLVAEAEARGLRFLVAGRDLLRLVTHLEIDDEDVAAALDVLNQVCR